MTETPMVRSTEANSGWDRAATAVVREEQFPWWLLLILGAASILFGVAVLVWPGATIRVTAAFVGAWLLVAGIGRILGAFVSGRGVGAQVLSGIVGVLLILGGVACLRNLVTSLVVLASVVAFMWLFSGLSELVIAFMAQGPTRVWLIVLGAVSTLVGLAFAVWPGLSLAAMVIMMSVSALAVGVGQLVAAFQLRKVSTAQ